MSNKKECPGCAMEIDKDAEICPYCQYEFPGSRSGLIWIGILLLLLSLIYPIIKLVEKIVSSL